jgi:small subunit ribosomal protein S16
MGAKKRPFYRVIVAEKRGKRDGRFIEIVGHYNPLTDPAQVKLDQERIDYWIKCGAQPSDTVKSLIRRSQSTAPAEPAA